MPRMSWTCGACGTSVMAKFDALRRCRPWRSHVAAYDPRSGARVAQGHYDGYGNVMVGDEIVHQPLWQAHELRMAAHEARGELPSDDVLRLEALTDVAAAWAVEHTRLVHVACSRDATTWDPTWAPSRPASSCSDGDDDGGDDDDDDDDDDDEDGMASRPSATAANDAARCSASHRAERDHGELRGVQWSCAACKEPLESLETVVRAAHGSNRLVVGQWSSAAGAVLAADGARLASLVGRVRALAAAVRAERGALSADDLQWLDGLVAAEYERALRHSRVAHLNCLQWRCGESPASHDLTCAVASACLRNDTAPNATMGPWAASWGAVQAGGAVDFAGFSATARASART